MAAALEGPLLAGRLNQNAPHGFRRGGEEVPTPVELLIANETEVGFVDERRGIEGVVGSFRSQTRRRQPPQLIVDEWEELPGCLAIASVDGLQDTSDFRHHRQG